MYYPILIHGPTASGKTEFAIRLAKALNGEIVNADSIQVYQDLHIISARPSVHEEKRVPHHLFGHIDGGATYSVGHWLEEAKAKIADIKSRKKTPIVVGGTGLYHLALIKGLSEVPPISEDIKSLVRNLQKEKGSQAVHQKLAKLDPEGAEHLQPGDKQRVMRAYEVLLSTGKPLRSFHADARPAILEDQYLGICLTPPRNRLYAGIDRRFGAMLMSGGIEEIKALLARDLDPDLPILRAHGVPWFIAYLKGELDAELAAENAKRDTRRYAKRQMTWVAHQFPFWVRIPSLDANDRVRAVRALYRDLKEKNALPAV